MNKDKLKQFVDALDALSDDIKDWNVDMGSYKKPTCDTPGCHAGLISIVAEDLPELQDIYEPLFSRFGGFHSSHYVYHIWGRALAVFLGFTCSHDLGEWAENNPELWGNKFGSGMFGSFLAFTDKISKQLTHRDIIEHWKQVLVNIEKGV